VTVPSTDESRRITRRLSQLLADEVGSQILAQLQRQRLANAPIENDSITEARNWEPRLGVWRPERMQDGLGFVRDPGSADDWWAWADVDQIPPKGIPRRVVLLGESVARGYFYEPALSAAHVLHAALDEAAPQCYEVVDLARVDLGISQLADLLRWLPLAKPDVLVVFAGNNWGGASPSHLGFQQLADALRDGGFPALRDLCLTEVLRPAAEGIVSAIAETASALSCAAIFVVPDFNLSEWQREEPYLVPYLASGTNGRWLHARRSAEQCLADGLAAEALAWASQMCELDGGTSPVGHYLAAEALTKMGRHAEIQHHLERARDAACGLYLHHAPCCPRDVQDAIRRKAAESASVLVDLPIVFSEATEIAHPRLFLDYCHLTLEGLGLAMSSVAREVLTADGIAKPSLRSAALRVDVTPEVEARAHFLAAIHNAHHGQPYEVVARQCRQAAALSAQVRAEMESYIASQLDTGEPWTASAFEDLYGQPAFQRYWSPMGAVTAPRLADFELLRAIAASLEDWDATAPARLDQLLVRLAGSLPSRIDLLLDRYWAKTFRARDGFSRFPKRAYYRGLEPVSSFCLLLTAPQPVTLTMTIRVPHGSKAQADASVSLNDGQIMAVGVSRIWKTHVARLDAEQTKGGLNRLDIAWPEAIDCDEAIEDGARRLERCLFPEILPSYGDIHTLTACRSNEYSYGKA
jgi:hypothetical protein